jgi:hypothetical protein
VLTIGVPLRGTDDIAYGYARRVTGRLVGADFRLRRVSADGPVFREDGSVAGLTSIVEADDERFAGDVPIVSQESACAVVRLAEGAMGDSPPPDAAHLPMEPDTTVTLDVLKDAIVERAGSLEPYAMSSSDFEIGSSRHCSSIQRAVTKVQQLD